MDASHKSVLVLQRRIASLLVWRAVLAFSTAWLFLWGIAALIIRVAAGVPRDYLLAAFGGLIPVMIIGAIMEYRKRPDLQQVRALLDCMNRCGGLLMVGETVDISSWREQMPKMRMPQIKWDASRSWTLFAASLLFAGISVFMPDRYTFDPGSDSLEIAEVVDELEEQIELLEEESILEEDQAEELEMELDRVERAASGHDPVKTWEALDHIAEATEEAANEAAEEAIAQMKEMSLSAAAAEALSELAKEDSSMSQSDLAETLGELAAMMEQAGLEKLLSEMAEAGELTMSAESLASLFSGCEGKSLSAEQLKQLSEMLKQGTGSMLNTMKKLCEAQMIDPSMLKMCKGGTNGCNSAALAQFLSENPGSCSLAAAMCMMPGQGGVTRGRGDAPMTWKDASSEENVKFVEKALPTGAMTNPEDSKLVGISVSAPEVDDGSGAAGSGAMAGTGDGESSAAVERVLPRHKTAVQKYFEREE